MSPVFELFQISRKFHAHMLGICKPLCHIDLMLIFKKIVRKISPYAAVVAEKSVKAAWSQRNLTKWQNFSIHDEIVYI